MAAGSGGHMTWYVCRGSARFRSRCDCRSSSPVSIYLDLYQCFSCRWLNLTGHRFKCSTGCGCTDVFSAQVALRYAVCQAEVSIMFVCWAWMWVKLPLAAVRAQECCSGMTRRLSLAVNNRYSANVWFSLPLSLLLSSLLLNPLLWFFFPLLPLQTRLLSVLCHSCSSFVWCYTHTHTHPAQAELWEQAVSM